jgi:hypothetical protein
VQVFLMLGCWICGQNSMNEDRKAKEEEIERQMQQYQPVAQDPN